MKKYFYAMTILVALFMGNNQLKAATMYSHSLRPTGDYNNSCTNITMDIRSIGGVTYRVIAADCPNSNGKRARTIITLPFETESIFDVVLTNDNGTLRVVQ